MPRFTSLFATLGALLVLVAPAALAQAQPMAVPVEPVKDFELVTKGETIVHEFVIRNDGNAPLQLTDVRPACGCTIAEYDQTIAPGETGTVRAKVETDTFSGPISKSIAVFTNDPANPKLQLVVKADVRPYIHVDPGYARFNYVQGEAMRPITQRVRAEDGKDLQVVKVNVPYDHLKVSFREAPPEERDPKAPDARLWLVDVALDPNAPIGALRDYLTIEIDHPKQKVVKIPISGFVRPRQHVTPQQVDFGELESTSLPLRRTLAFTNFITNEIELTGVETGYDAVTAQVESTGDAKGHRFLVTLEIGPGMPKGPFNSVVKIHTSDDKNPVVEVPVNGTIL